MVSTSLFHLRPVRDVSMSPASSTSITPPNDTASKPNFASARSPSSAVGRRGPSPLPFLRDVDLTHNERAASRNLPAPPTGHELMAMFPPQAPATEPHPTSTSGLFRHQERAFFAQSGREIVRIKLDPDVKMDVDRKPSFHQRQWSAPQPHHMKTHSTANHPPLVPHNHSPALSHRPQRPPSQSHRPSPTSPIHATIPSKQRQSSTGLRTPPQDSMPPPRTKPEPSSEEYRTDDPDEAWRRPMPFAERRRAGKHTRRIIVQKN